MVIRIFFSFTGVVYYFFYIIQPSICSGPDMIFSQTVIKIFVSSFCTIKAKAVYQSEDLLPRLIIVTIMRKLTLELWTRLAKPVAWRDYPLQYLHLSRSRGLNFRPSIVLMDQEANLVIYFLFRRPAYPKSSECQHPDHDPHQPHLQSSSHVQ